MSDLWNHASAAAAARVSAFDRPAQPQNFTPWSTAFGAQAVDPPSDDPAAGGSVIDPTDLEAVAYAEGFNEGRRAIEMEVAAERNALARLAEALECLQPEPSRDLGAMLAETVERLVREIVGEVRIDRELLIERAMNAAALIAEDSTPTKMRVHPDDFTMLEGADLPIDLIADAAIAPGTILVESGEGWIEDGPEVGLEKLRIALDKMGLPR